MNTDIYSFIFRGVLAQTSIAEQRHSLQHPSNDVRDNEARLPLGLMDEDIVLQARRMAVIYTAIAAFENSARQFIKKRLIEEKQDNWADAIPNERRKKSEIRRDEENKIRWHARRGDSILEYTEIEDLSAIITTNQDIFVPIVVSVEWSKNIFNTVARSRNIIMHSGTLESEDVERLAMAIRDWLNQIGG